MKQNFFLTIKCGWFYSYIDEDSFFEWLKKIKSVIDCKGEGRNLLIYFKSKKINAEELRELFALFRRYKIGIKALEIFLNEKNKEWFDQNKQSCRHKNVYPQKSSKD